MKNLNSSALMLSTQINAAMAWPLKLTLYLVTQVIELVINIPVMNTIWRERREMELLSDEHIKDMGLTPYDVRLEIKRSFFDIPKERKRFLNKAQTLHTCRTF